jgi:hypothetical protein
MTLDQVKHVLRELGWRDEGGGKVDVFLYYGSGGWTTGETTIDAGLVRVDTFGGHGPKWIDPAEITSISKPVLSDARSATARSCGGWNDARRVTCI